MKFDKLTLGTVAPQFTGTFLFITTLSSVNIENILYNNSVSVNQMTICQYSLGISILESESGADGITMEMDMQWDGNPNIVLNINTKLGVSLPVQVTFICCSCLKLPSLISTWPRISTFALYVYICKFYSY